MNIFCSQDVNPYVQIECGIDQAGIVAAAFVNLDVLTPTKAQIESLAWWTNLTNDSPATTFVSTRIRGEYPGGTPTEEDGFGRKATQITGAKHEATIEFEGLEENRAFVEGVNRRDWKVALITAGNKILFIDNPVSVYLTPSIPRGITNVAFWKGTLKWQDYSNPIIGTAPLYFFDE